MSDQFFILKAKTDGYALSTIPLFVMLLTAIQSLSSYYSGYLSDKIGVIRTLQLAFVFGLLSVSLMDVELWAAFTSLGLFTIFSLNAVRSYISAYASSKGFVFGVFYGGVAISTALGALAIGYIWQLYGFDRAMLFSEVGMSLMFLILLLKKA